jgi:hypothetical protein
VTPSFLYDGGTYKFPEFQYSLNAEEYQWWLQTNTTYENALNYVPTDTTNFSREDEPEGSSYNFKYYLKENNSLEQYGLAAPTGDNTAEITYFPPDYSYSELANTGNITLGFAGTKIILPEWFKTFYGFDYVAQKGNPGYLEANFKLLYLPPLDEVYDEFDVYIGNVKTAGFTCTPTNSGKLAEPDSDGYTYNVECRGNNILSGYQLLWDGYCEGGECTSVWGVSAN